jgi:hypothetical protein
MNPWLKRMSIPILRLALGIFLIIASWFPFHHAILKISGAEPAGHLNWIRLFISGAEGIAALLFLIPPTSRLGGYILLVVFAAAILVHALHGDFQELDLLVYAAAVLAVMAHEKS